MDDGFYFYWVSWIAWTFLTFFITRNQLRISINIWILLLIITSQKYVQVDEYYISYGFIILLIGAIYFHVFLPWQWKSLFIAFTIMISYITIRLWEKLAPVWLFIPSLMLIPLTIVGLLLVLSKNLYIRLVSILLGVSFGELIYSLILTSYYLNSEVVQVVFFDYLALMILIVGCIHFIRILSLNTIQSIMMFIHTKRF